MGRQWLSASLLPAHPEPAAYRPIPSVLPIGPPTLGGTQPNTSPSPAGIRRPSEPEGFSHIHLAKENSPYNRLCILLL